MDDDHPLEKANSPVSSRCNRLRAGWLAIAALAWLGGAEDSVLPGGVYVRARVY